MFATAPLRLSKYSATGNDFILLGHDTPPRQAEWDVTFGRASRAELAKRLCHRTEGLGADGLLVFEPGQDVDWTWDFYNSDGSTAEMCGNAARCAALWAHRERPKQKTFRFRTKAGLITCHLIASNAVEVEMPEVKAQTTPIEIKVGAQSWTVLAVNSGVPHAVMEVSSPFELDKLLKPAQDIRQSEAFQPTGTNVTFFRSLTPSRLQAVSFERGVENFTLACGTGAVAAAYCQRQKTGEQTLTVELRGGRVDVEFSTHKVLLRGPALWVADCFLPLSNRGEPST